MSLIGTYSFNLISITFFLLPSIIFFNKSLTSKILTIIFALFFFGTNIYFGKNVIDKYNKVEFTNLDTTIKIISPKIEIKLDEIGVTQWILSNGIKVILKPTNFKNDEILFYGFSPGGHSLIDDVSFISAVEASDIVSASMMMIMMALLMQMILMIMMQMYVQIMMLMDVMIV